MMFWDLLLSDLYGFALPIRLLLLTTPLLLIGMGIAWWAEKRSPSTVESSLILRHTLLITGIAVLFTLAFGSLLTPLVSSNIFYETGSITTQDTVVPFDSQMPTVSAPVDPPQVPPFVWGREQTTVLYLLVTTLLLSVTVTGAIVLHRLSLRAVDAPLEVTALLDDSASTKTTLRPCLRISSAITSPLTVALPGMRSPVILLPISSASDAPETLRPVLAHEIAHLKRHDGEWTLMLRLFTALLWFQPLLWLLSYRMECAAELDCDAEALRQLARSSEPSQMRRQYATRLLDYTESAREEGLWISRLSGERIVGKGRSRSSLFLQERIERIMENRQSDTVAPSRSWRNGATIILSLTALLGILLFGASNNSPSAQAYPTQPENSVPPVGIVAETLPKVTGSWIDEPIEQVLKEVLNGTGFSFTLSPTLPQRLSGTVTLAVTRIPLDKAIILVLRSSSPTRLKQRRVGKTFVIEPAQLDKDGLPQRNLRVTVKDTPLRTALELLFRGTDGTFTLPDSLNDRITVDTGKEAPFPIALQAVLKAYPSVPLTYSPPGVQSEVVFIQPVPRRLRSFPPPPSDPLPNQQITVAFEGTPLRVVLEQLLQEQGLDYSIAPGIEGNVTLHAKDRPFAEVFQSLLKQSKTPVTYSYYSDEGVVTIVFQK